MIANSNIMKIHTKERASKCHDLLQSFKVHHGGDFSCHSNLVPRHILTHPSILYFYSRYAIRHAPLKTSCAVNVGGIQQGKSA